MAQEISQGKLENNLMWLKNIQDTKSWDWLPRRIYKEKYIALNDYIIT